MLTFKIAKLFDGSSEFALDVLECPRCGGRMRIPAAIEDPSVARKILDSLGLRSRPPPGHLAYLYDGMNIIEESSGGSPVVNLPNGSLDEVLTRTDAAGTMSFFTDTTGSTVALADGTAQLQTRYTYQPFGETTQAGATSTNQRQFTGRENDSTGLYYYRARLSLLKTSSAL